MLTILTHPDQATIATVLKRPSQSFEAIEKIISPILTNVKINGDKALHEYSILFDKNDLENFAVSQKEIDEAKQFISDELKSAIYKATENIGKFHARQKGDLEAHETTSGVSCWRKSIGIEKVGLYIPGGSAPLFSTVLMLAIPAKIANCKEIVLCSPPNSKGKIHPAILFAADYCGITKIFKIGGAQAIAAMAYGTASVPQVYKIFGPGNQYVTAAKQMINKEGIAIDMPAGPSEVCVIADHSSNPSFVAADLLSQAEHGADSQVLCISTNEAIAYKIALEVENLKAQLPRNEIASKALENSKIIVVESIKEAINISNQYAPEHLILAIENPDQYLDLIINAGSVFVGHNTPESAGDYASGTNHTLPTNGHARAYSGVSLDSFVKKITFQKISKEGLQNLGNTIITMAEAEGLDAHALAVKVRLEAKN
jgi:histidinol dehydrogenase